MAREFFKNLPDTSTPLNAQRMNGLLNGEEAMGSIVVDDIKNKNLFNPLNVVNLFPNEDFFSVAANEYTFYIECEPSTAYSIQRTSANTSGLIVCCSAEMPAPRVATINTNNFGNINKLENYITPNNAKYLCVRINPESGTATLEQIKKTFQIEKGIVATSQVPYKKYGYNNSESMGNIIVDDIKSKNLFNINNLTLRTGSINYSTGVITVNRYDNQSTNALKDIAPDLVAGETYTLSLSTTGNNRFIFLFGSNSIWLSGNQRILTQEELDGKIIIYGIMESTETVNISNIQIEKGSTITPFTPYKNFSNEVYCIEVNIDSVNGSYQNDLLKDAKYIVCNFYSTTGNWNIQTQHLTDGLSFTSMQTTENWYVGSRYDKATGTITFITRSENSNTIINKIMVVK